MAKAITNFPISGYGLIDGAHLNKVVAQINNATGFGTPQPMTASSLSLSAAGRFRFSTVPVGSVAYASFGNNTATVAGSILWADLEIPNNILLTGVGILNGATVGTDKGIAALYDTNGNLLANSALAGATTVGASAFQQYAFTAQYAAVGPGHYFIGYQSNGTTDTVRTVAASTFIDVLTASATGAFGTLTALTPPTTFTANVGPIAYVY